MTAQPHAQIAILTCTEFRGWGPGGKNGSGNFDEVSERRRRRGGVALFRVRADSGGFYVKSIPALKGYFLNRLGNASIVGAIAAFLGRVVRALRLGNGIDWLGVLHGDGRSSRVRGELPRQLRVKGGFFRGGGNAGRLGRIRIKPNCIGTHRLRGERAENLVQGDLEVPRDANPSVRVIFGPYGVELAGNAVLRFET